MQSNDITFYQRFEADILAGRKTITIRDKFESHFKAGDILRVGRFEDNQYFCTIEVLSVSPITIDELTELHAKQENMGLDELKEVIRGIYPTENQLYVIKFKLIDLGEDMENSDVIERKHNSFLRFNSLNKTSLIIIVILITMFCFIYNKLDNIQSYIWYQERSLSEISDIINNRTNDKDFHLKEKISELENELDKLNDNLDKLNNKIDGIDNILNSEFSLTINKKDSNSNTSYSYNSLDNKNKSEKTTIKDDLDALKKQILESKTSYSDKPTLKDSIEELENNTKNINNGIQNIKFDTQYIRTFIR